MAPELSDTDVGIICERLTERYSKRDTKIGIRNAFIFRRDDASAVVACDCQNSN